MDRALMLKIAGEMGTKSARTRRRFLRVLARNVRAALERHEVPGRLEPRWSRVFVRTDQPDRARAGLAGVFGLHSISDVVILKFRGLDDLVARAADTFRERVAGRTFAVRARRAGEHPFRSPDVARELGTALLSDSGGVDLGRPEVEVSLEIGQGEAYAILDSVPGGGGLPVGTGGRAVALFSGGFDSPVAAWMTMRRGTALDLVVCDLGECGEVDGALAVARELADRWAPGVEPRAHVIGFAAVVAALKARVEPRLRQVLLKRSMYRAGTLVAEDIGADALVTGEALGQVSTQTLRNLAVAEEAAGMPVLRPLIGMDKEEIIRRARAIGTHDASERVVEHCSIAEGRVETGATLREVLTAEGNVDEGFIRAAVARRQEVDLLTWEPGPPPAHVLEEVPDQAVIVDVREEGQGSPVGDLRLPYTRAHEWSPGLDRNRTYLFVCSHGLRSESLAHELQRRGIRAFSLAGGIGRLPIRAA
jgi:thiamine biosynthesis protein ThiI